MYLLHVGCVMCMVRPTPRILHACPLSPALTTAWTAEQTECAAELAVCVRALRCDRPARRCLARGYPPGGG